MKPVEVRAHRRLLLLPLALAALAACSSGGDDTPTPPPTHTLSRVDVTPAAPWLLVGSTANFYATAYYSDASSSDVTQQATWTSSAGTLLSVSNAAGTRGLANAVAVGPATVTATYDGIAGSTSATVVAPGTGITIEGTVAYDFVPATYDPATDSGTLAFGAAAQRPVRGAIVRAMQGATVLTSTYTDELGRYALTFPTTTGTISVTALAKTQSPPIQVEDNTDGDAIWAIAASVPAANGTLNLHATHGWTGSSYSAVARSAAPFAILDSMYTAAKAFMDIRSPSFPTLAVRWSPDNVSSSTYNPAIGFIYTSHFSPSENAIYILGKDGEDTDEYDSHVIVHEWSHYFEENLSRSDSPGGSHGMGDVLDPRLSFGEGYATALAAILLGDPIYADTGWWNGYSLDAFGFDAETVPTPTDDCVGYPCVVGLNPGPFSEMSIIRAFYDLCDDSGSAESWDAIAVPLGTIYDVLVGPEKTTPALTTIASFITGLKGAGVDAAAVNAVLAHYSIGAITDEWGTGDSDLRAMYRNVSVPSTGNSFTFDGTSDWNMQDRNRYFVFTATGTSATVTSACSYDVDLYAYRSGELLDFDESYDGNETLNFATTPGNVYVIWVNGYANTGGNYSGTINVSTP
jgi:Big-like domain-containing protein